MPSTIIDVGIEVLRERVRDLERDVVASRKETRRLRLWIERVLAAHRERERLLDEGPGA